MVTRNAKLKLIESFYAIDYIIFGKPVSEVEYCCPVMVNEYLALKGVLLSNMIEMYNLVQYNPTSFLNSYSTKNLKNFAREEATICKENSLRILGTHKGKKEVSRILKEFVYEKNEENKKEKNAEQLAEDAVKHKAFSIAIDNLLISNTIRECEDFSKMNDWRGKILEESYKIIRDNLVEIGAAILESDESVK